MEELEKLEILNLYLFLCDKDNLSELINNVLIKLEKEVFEKYSVVEIEGYRSIFTDKGKV